MKANTTTDEIEKTRREKLAGHCFALSQVTYTALVLGSLFSRYECFSTGRVHADIGSLHGLGFLFGRE